MGGAVTRKRIRTGRRQSKTSVSESTPHVIGLTGPFGSGCSSAATILAERLGHRAIRLSSLIRDQWNKEHAGQHPTREDLQNLGNRMRMDADDPGRVARLAIDAARDGPTPHTGIVLDGIRNVGEIETCREAYGRKFYLAAIDCPASQRLERLRGIYGDGPGAERNFAADNERDRDQEDPLGQQVELCVDSSDLIIRNDDTVTLRSLRNKLIEFVRVLTGEDPRYPRPSEILMNFAYSAALGSKCLKRQVGAVVVVAKPGVMGDVVGLGFNENPAPTAPCVEEAQYGANPETGTPGRCHKDIVQFESFVQAAERRLRCPSCGELLAAPLRQTPPWRCADCGANLVHFFWPERAMSWCTAVHAEVAAVLSAGSRARGATLYTTTYPCFQCAEKIIQVGITDVVFTETYPDIKAAHRLDIAGIATHPFEGVRSGRFDEIFSRARPYVEAQLQKIRAGKT